jgi:hypothetical protein
LSLWALFEGINKLKAVVLMILPTLFTLAITAYFLILVFRLQDITGIPLPIISVISAILYGICFYSLLLSQNVFNVASIRTIPLYRAASTVAFMFTIITAFLLYNVIESFNLIFMLNAWAVFLLSFPLILQIIWSIDMEGLTTMIIWYSIVIAVALSEIALALSFWPINNVMASLIIATALYIFLGTTTHFLRDRLSSRTAWEYVVIGLVMFMVGFVTTSWVG